MTQDVTVYENFFPKPLLESLIAQTTFSPVRKQQFDLNKPVPPTVSKAAELASNRLGLTFNVAILKWYRTNDNADSTAYDYHVDPNNLTSIPLVLCSLSGEATLTYITEDVEQTISCKPNMVITLNPKFKHRVSPPLNADGERLFLFLGYDTNL